MRRIRTAATAAALAFLLAVAVTGCGGGGSDGTEAQTVKRPGEPTTTSSTLVPPPGDATATTAAGGRAGGGNNRSGGSGGGSSGAAPAPARGGLAPAPAGTYSYDTSGVATFGLTTLPFPGVTSLVVDPPSGTRQHATRNLRDAAGSGLMQEMVLDFRAEGIFIENLKLTTTFSGSTNSLDLRPTGPALLLPTGAGPGAHSEFDVTDGAGTGHVVVDVIGREQVSAGGRGVDALILRAVAALPGPSGPVRAGDAGPDITGQVEINYWFAPSVRLPVKERVVSDASAAGGLIRFHSEYTATIQRVP